MDAAALGALNEQVQSGRIRLFHRGCPGLAPGAYILRLQSPARCIETRHARIDLQRDTPTPHTCTRRWSYPPELVNGWRPRTCERNSLSSSLH